MKIDVEGHEAAVLDGAKSVLSAQPSVLQIECYPGCGGESKHRLQRLGFSELTAIGPDHYFANMKSLLSPPAIIEIYEQACRDMIAYYHREKPVMLERGDIRLEIAGKTANLARGMKKLVRRR
jgi:hypothetical protein